VTVRISLRWKLVAALVLTSAATLLGAIIAISPPLEHRIAEDQLHSLGALARTSRFALAGLSAEDLKPRSHELRRIAHNLEVRTGGRVAIFDTNGRPLIDTDPIRRDPKSGELERIQDAGLARTADVQEGIQHGEVVVVSDARTLEGRLTLVLRKPLTDTRAAAAVFRRGLPLAIGIGLGIALLLGTLMSFGLLRRLRALHREAQGLGGDNIGEPLPLDRTADEVGDLSRALEAMRARLQAEEASRQSFLSTASHELRTPVAALQGMLELLEEELQAEAPGLGAARRRAAAATRQSRRLAQLTADLLDLSRLDGDVTLREEPVDLAELCAAVMSEFSAVADEAGVELRLEHDDAPQDGTGGAWALADAPAVARIMRLLLDNALRYGAGGGEAVVRVHGDGATAIVQVADRGTGLAPGEHERVFARFERGAAGERKPGFGLGLPIGRGLARRMGGDLIAQRDRPVGAAFTLTLPACAPPLSVLAEPAVGPGAGDAEQAAGAPG
jgi:signal transduction histidine kinase